MAVCDGVTITDGLSAFDWVCDDADGSARAISTGLADGAHLSTLLDFTPGAVAWLPNSITATNGTITASTQPTVWWENPVVEDNDGGSLTDAGTIFVVTADPNAIYRVSADEVALVTAPGVVLRGGATEGSYGMVYSQGLNFSWLEARLDGAGQKIGASLSGNFVVLDAIVVDGLTGQPGRGIRATGAAFYGKDLEVRGGIHEGMELDASHSTWKRLLIENNGQTGLLSSADDSWFENVVITGNGGYSLSLDGTEGVVFRDVTAAASARGVSIDNCTNSRFEGLRVLNDDDRNGVGKALVHVFGGRQCAFKDLVAINGSGTGLRVTGSGHMFSNVITANSDYRGVLVQADGNAFLTSAHSMRTNTASRSRRTTTRW